MYLKFISFGLPRSGKSSTFKRLIGEIINLRKLGGVSRSTGVAECRDVIIKPFKSVPAAIVGSDETLSKWESLKSKPTEGNEKASFGDSKVDHKYLAHLYFHLISSNATEITTEDKPNITNKVYMDRKMKHGIQMYLIHHLHLYQHQFSRMCCRGNYQHLQYPICLLLQS